MNVAEVYKFARDLGVVPEEGEKNPVFLKRFGEFVSRYVANQQSVENILDSVSKRHLQDPRVLKLVAAVRAESGDEDVKSKGRDRGVKIAELEADDTEYPEDDRRELIDKFYPKHDSMAIAKLYKKEKALKFMAAPPTQALIYDDFIDSARSFVRSSKGLGGPQGRFMSLQRLAGTARYDSGYNERLIMCQYDLDELDSLRIRINDGDVVTGPALIKLLDVEASQSTKLTHAPSRLALDGVLNEAAEQLGSAPKELVDKGYLIPAQAALVVDMTRVLSALRSK